jgi:glycosyltransferase involved in cell wall biosynthesis
MSGPTIAVCLPQVPFTRGGAELLADALVRHLKLRGFPAELIQIPFSFFPKRQLIFDSIIWRMQELKEITGRQVDVVIPLKFPAYMLRHGLKIPWLCHQHRAAYDLFDTPFTDFKNDDEGCYYRDLIQTMDNRVLPECRKIFTIGQVVSGRLKRYNSIQSEVMHIPMIRDLPLRSEGYGDYLLHVGRLNLSKRIEMAFEALAQTSSPIKFLLAGRGEYEDELKKKAEELGVTGRVEFLGFVSEEELVDLYANAFAVYFAPKDEDFGLITIEAFNARRPVVTCVDAGGPLEFVFDGESGAVCEPTPEAIALKLDELYRDRDLCRSLGQAGYDKVKDLTWDRTIERLSEHF